MDKAELLDRLSQKFTGFLTPDLIRTKDDVNEYTIEVYDVDGDIVLPQIIGFYVKNEGVASEAAFWKNSEPKSRSAFAKEVDDYIAAKIASGLIEAAWIGRIDENAQTAYGAVIRLLESKIVKNEVFLYKEDGVLHHEIIN